jgi:hypothetical protein
MNVSGNSAKHLISSTLILATEYTIGLHWEPRDESIPESITSESYRIQLKQVDGGHGSLSQAHPQQSIIINVKTSDLNSSVMCTSKSKNN